jgi:hypothetical protein
VTVRDDRKEEPDVDLILMALSGGLSFWGSGLRESDGPTNQAGRILIVVGVAILAIGAIIFAVSFGMGFNQGLQEGMQGG